MESIDQSACGYSREGSVLFLLSALIVGGSERKAIAIANTLFTRGWDVRIAYIDAPDRSPRPLEDMIVSGIPVFCLGRHGKYSVPAVSRLARYLRNASVSRIITVNLHPLLYALPARLAAGMRRARVIALVNTMYSHKAGPGVMTLYGRLLGRADHVVFGSRSQMQSWTDAHTVKASNASCIYNGIDLGRFARLQRESADQGQPCGINAPTGFTVGTVAQLRPEKNLAELLTAVAQVINGGRQVKVLIVGDGPERGALEALAQVQGIHDHVTFVGQVDDVRPLLAAMDVFVLTSVVETFSNAALEAMAMACPVVLSRVGGAAEMVTPGVEGYLYASGKPDELAVVLDTEMADPARRKSLGENARHRVENEFAWERMITDYEAIIESRSLDARHERRPITPRGSTGEQPRVHAAREDRLTSRTHNR